MYVVAIYIIMFTVDIEKFLLLKYLLYIVLYTKACKRNIHFSYYILFSTLSSITVLNAGKKCFDIYLFFLFNLSIIYAPNGFDIDFLVDVLN